MVRFNSLPTHSKINRKGGINMANMEVRILVISNGETGRDIRNGMV